MEKPSYGTPAGEVLRCPAWRAGLALCERGPGSGTTAREVKGVTGTVVERKTGGATGGSRQVEGNPHVGVWIVWPSNMWAERDGIL